MAMHLMEGYVNAVPLSEKAGTYLRRLCLDIPGRRVGSEGNRAATEFFAATVASFGFQTEPQAFSCVDWTTEGARLAVGGTAYLAHVSPYSPGCQVRAPLAVATNVEELDALQVSDSVLLLRGDLAKEQLMPKNFPFYNPDAHKRIIRLLETQDPRAIVAATSHDVQVAGAVYPFPLIEDGDFDIPSVYVTEEDGDRLAECAGEDVSLEIRAQRNPAVGYNVVARKGADPSRRVVLFAHIDAKEGTRGAIDNATGIAVLLLLAELLADDAGDLVIEIVALNGEDYYSSPGEQLYLELNADRFAEIVLGVNLDGVGYCQGRTAYSTYGCAPDLASAIRSAFSAHDDIVEGEPWYQGDHFLFTMHQRPALALTSERVAELLKEVIHTSRDSPEIVDTGKLADVALALRELLLGGGLS
jgi:aminopeptidase YwaD